MRDTGLRAKYIHRFHVEDADANGVVDRSDILLRAERLIDGMDEPLGSPGAAAVLAGAEAYWQRLAELAGVDEDGELTEDVYVQTLEEAVQVGAIAGLVAPSVEAHVQLADSEGTGTVALDDFIRAQVASGMSTAMASEAFEALDRDGDGRITVEEWQRAVLDYYTNADADVRAPGSLVMGLRAEG